MKKSKLAIASFVLSFIPIVIPLLVILGVMIFGRPPGSTISIGRLFTAGSYLLFMSFLGTFWFEIIPIILGIIALVKIKKNQLEGKGLAVAGIVISALSIIIVLVFGLVVGVSS